MREIPACLSRRYNALDELIRDLSAMSNRSSSSECPGGVLSRDPEIKLMCDFWKILKEDPCCNMQHSIHQRMSSRSSRFRDWSHVQKLTCYMANEERPGSGKEDPDKINMTCCNKETAETDKAAESEPPLNHCCASTAPSEAPSDNLPLCKVLCNLKEAASFDKKCTARVADLVKTEKQLRLQIQYLESKEAQGVANLKQAECMWSCMEEAYKQKVAESLERQKEALKQLKEVEKSAAKWRKNKKDLESQVKNINKCQKEITENINTKSNDLKGINSEIEGLKKRMEATSKELAGLQRSFGTKKLVSDAKIAKIAKEEAFHAKNLRSEKADKKNKEDEGNQYIKEAREELQKICKVLLQKKLENEDLVEERNALKAEVNMLQGSCDLCKEKCKEKQLSIGAEINKLDAEIATNTTRCIRCHANIDTNDMRKLCVDCPRCVEERECLVEGDHCTPDKAMDCVCQSIKKKFLDNVFENMYTVLERQVQSGPGKAVGDAVLDCLKRSRNGKLNEDTKRVLQEFILTTVKRNLNLTIVGGAVKTRCEMDPDTYNQLMLCLKKMKVTPVPKEDKATNVKKEPCRRWAGTNECNCPKGPKACICTKKAPRPPHDPTPCPPDPEDKEDAGEKVVCPHKSNTTCGPDCAARGLPNMVGADVASWRPDPCSTKACPYSKNMRAAQCVLGPESLSSAAMSYKTAVPLIPSFSAVDEPNCKCGKKATKNCDCHGGKESKSRPRQRFIEEVMGRYYLDIAPIEKVSSVGEYEIYRPNMGRLNIEQCIRSTEMHSFKQTNACTKHRTSQPLTHTSEDISIIKDDEIDFIMKDVDLYNITEELGTQLLLHYLESVNKSLEDLYSTNVRDETQLPVVPLELETIKDEEPTRDVQITVDIESKKLSHHIIDTAALFEDIKSLRDDSVNQEDNNLVSSIIEKKKRQEYLKHTIKSSIEVDHETEESNSGNIEWVTADSLLEKINDLLKESTHSNKSSVKEGKSSRESFKTCSQFIETEKNTTCMTTNDIESSTWIAFDPTIEEVIKVTDIKHEVNKKLSKQKFSPSNDIKISNKPSITTEFDPEKEEISSKYATDITQEPVKDPKQLKAVNKNRRGIDIWQQIEDVVGIPISKSSEIIEKETEQTEINNKKVLIKNSKKAIATDLLKQFNYNIDDIRNNSLENIKSGATDAQNIAEVIVTKSGALVLELSDEVYEKINKKNDHSSDLFVSLIKTKSGHCMLDFDPPQNQSIVRMTIKKTQSANLTLEINRILVEDWFPCNSYCDSNNDTENTKSFVSIEVTRRMKRRLKEKKQKEQVQQETKREELHQRSEIEDKTSDKTCVASGTRKYGKKENELSEEKSNINEMKSKVRYSGQISVEDIIGKNCNLSLTTEDYKNEFSTMWLENKKKVLLKVYAVNGVEANVQGVLTKTLSGNMALDVRNISSVGEISPEMKEFPVLLKKTFGETYILFLGLKDNSIAPNCVLRMTPSGEILVVISKPVLTSRMSHRDAAHNMTKDKLFKIQVKESSNDLIETPALLKSTNSDNYILVLNKEFEKEHRNSLNACLGEKKECFIEVRKTTSDTVVTNFVESPFDPEKPHALLVRSPSDSFKIIVNGPVFDNKLQNLDSKKAFEELFSKKRSSEGNKNKNLPFNNNTSIEDKKSRSDSNMFEKIRLKLQNKTGLLSDPSTVLKRTSSGQYAIVLDKETKKTFINDLKSYLTSTSRCRVPIKKTDTGEITIYLNESDDGTDQYGSLKISPSGNIYIIVKDSVINDINKVRSSLVGGIAEKHKDKAASTNNDTQPDACICEPSKCICEDLHKNIEDWLKNISGNMLSIDKNEEIVYSDKNCDPLYCIKNHCPSNEHMRPHIVIKPTQAQEADCFSKTEQCYYVFDSVCPLHKGRYETVSNEIIEISGLCSLQNRVSKSSDYVLDGSSGEMSDKSQWDNLSLLPPQLPPFLRDHLLLLKHSSKSWSEN